MPLHVGEHDHGGGVVNRRGDGNLPEQLSRGKSAEIPLDERFGNAERDREKKLSPGKSATIPYDERRGGGER
jgi:hypothetical protein